MRVQCILYSIFGRNYKCKCGHKAKWKTKFLVNEIGGVYTLQKNLEYCPTCWAKAAIKCAWCSKTIFCGEPVTLYRPKPEFKIPDYAVAYKLDPEVQLVGCLRWNCADSGVDRTGFWVMPGKVKRVASPLEMLMSGNGNLVVVNDLCNQKEAIPIPDEIAKPNE